MSMYYVTHVNHDAGTFRVGNGAGKSYTVIVRQPIGVRILWSKGMLKLDANLAKDILLTVLSYGNPNAAQAFAIRKVLGVTGE